MIQLSMGLAVIGAWIYSSGVTGSSWGTRPLNEGWSAARGSCVSPNVQAEPHDSCWLQFLCNSWGSGVGRGELSFLLITCFLLFLSKFRRSDTVFIFGSGFGKVRYVGIWTQRHLLKSKFKKVRPGIVMHQQEPRPHCTSVESYNES